MIDHAFVSDPFGFRDICDAKVEIGGRIWTCCQPRREHQVDTDPRASEPTGVENAHSSELAPKEEH